MINPGPKPLSVWKEEEQNITVTFFHFQGDLPALFKKKWRGAPSISIRLGRKASIKDVIESFGLPHTEVGSIIQQGREVGFSHIVDEGCSYEVGPVSQPWDVSAPSVLRPVPLPTVTFIVDVNVGRLARYLRAAGFDTLYDHGWNDRYIASVVRGEKRILLTRDMRLLMRNQVVFGRYVRAADPVAQFHEVVGLFGLEKRMDPFSRCLECNSLLQPVAREKVLHRLEPLTKKYYRSFSRCARCDRIYWPGSHVEKMRRLLAGQLDSWPEEQ